jgi:BirA family biotin operon repressor/biotin-[acetyl-CoA-carboxylase] ligase
MLRDSPKGISGESMAAALGVSRVAIWKAVQTLNAAGYRIEPAPTGYILETDPEDSIRPWEFGADESRFHYWEETDSTMNRAREEALTGAVHGTVIMANRQSAGRGTGEHAWESAEGGLFFTLVTRPGFNAAWGHRAVLAAQCALAEAAERTAGTGLFPAWPNDMLTDDGRKAAGILCETLSSGHRISFMNIGVGVNTGKRPDVPHTASIEAPRKEFLEAFLSGFARLSADQDDIVSAWKARCPDAGKTVRFRLTNPDGKNEGAVLTGTFLGVDRAGWALIAENGSDSAESFPPGSITILNKGHST